LDGIAPAVAIKLAVELPGGAVTLAGTVRNSEFELIPILLLEDTGFESVIVQLVDAYVPRSFALHATDDTCAEAVRLTVAVAVLLL
jgi:hypothetical protein